MLYNEKYMRKALKLAINAKGYTSPNPAVGAVIIKTDKIIGLGKTGKPGEPHAEVDAILNSAENTNGATMYVTLEPCCFYGRTPPCTDAIIKAGIKKVYIGSKDPNPRVSGKGIEILNNAGIKTQVGFLHKKLLELNEDFFKNIKTGLPFILVKYAQTLDGRIASDSGDSFWISSEKSRKYVHKLRSIYDAVLVGAGTVIKDNPKLTVRECKGRNPKRIILDINGEMPINSNVLIDEHDTIVITSSNDSNFFSEIDLSLVLKELSSMGIISILVEGGQKVITSFFEQNLVDKVMVFIAPKILLSGISPTLGKKTIQISTSLKLKSINQKKFSDDILITGYTRNIEDYLIN
jgi:diaminohydroxyphosphoribosylaminopyrimidine deaminase/5-amino-6-(5-phosphoribosylamino)uracil reductase